MERPPQPLPGVGPEAPAPGPWRGPFPPRTLMSNPQVATAMSEAMVFDPAGFVAEQVEAVRKQVGKRTAVIAVSGGVDSTIAAAIVNEAIGGQLHAVYVDTGFMRKGESEQVEAMYKRMGLNLTVVHAADEYFTALAGVTDPERKRKIIGERFIRIFERESQKTGAQGLVQGDRKSKRRN